MAGLQAFNDQSFPYHGIIADPTLSFTNTPSLTCPNNCQGNQWSRRIIEAKDLPEKPVYVLGPDNQAFQLVGGRCGYFEFQDWRCHECLAECYVWAFHWARNDFNPGFVGALNLQTEFMASEQGSQETSSHNHMPLMENNEPWSGIAGYGNDESSQAIGGQQSEQLPPQSSQPDTIPHPPADSEDLSTVQPDQGSDWKIVDRQGYRRRSRNIWVAQSQSDHAASDQQPATLRPSESYFTQNNRFDVLSTLRTAGPVPLPGTGPGKSSRSSSASNIGGKRFQNDPYKGWHYTLLRKFRVQGNKACSHCRQRRIQCRLGHLAREDLARIPRDFWDICPDKGRMLAELQPKGSPYTFPPFSQ